MAATNPRSLASAVADNVRDGDTVFLGGFGHAVPFALGHEVIRSGRSGLTICRSGADILADQMIASGCVRSVIFGWIGNPDVGISHAFRRSVAEGTIEWEEWTNWSMVLRFQAAATGVPFLPSRILLAGDGPDALSGLKTIQCPYTGEVLSAIPALAPDVALIHAQRADREGNVQLWGVIGDTVVGALASDRIVVSVEEIVDEDITESAPNLTVIPAHRVSAVCEVPWGAHPSYVEGRYTRDDAHYIAYDAASRTIEGAQEHLDGWVHGVTRAEYISMIDTGALVAS